MVCTREHNFNHEHPHDMTNGTVSCHGLFNQLADSLLKKSIFQNQVPGNWDQQMFGTWEDCRLLLCRVPSRHKRNTYFSVIIMFVLAHLQTLHDHLHFPTPQLRHIKGYMCTCKVGQRLSRCCSHISTVLTLGCTLAHAPNLYKSTTKACMTLSRNQTPAMNVALASQGLNQSHHQQTTGPWLANFSG